MEKYIPEIQATAIVLVGDFNPAIFNPTWFNNQNLIRKGEAETAETQILHPDVSSFNLEWLRCQVTRTQFVIETQQESHDEALRDLAIGTFKLLRHTPLRAMGINTQTHFKIGSIDQWHNIGHTLAPKSVWNGILSNPGMKSLTMEDSPRNDGYIGSVRVDVQPSVKVHPGLYFLINDHYNARTPEMGTGCDEIVEILSNNWDASRKMSSNIVKSLLEALL